MTQQKNHICFSNIYSNYYYCKYFLCFQIRNGPGRFEMGEHSFLNVFDGYAKLYSWQFSGNGSAFFTAKFVQSKEYQESLKIKDIALYMTFDDLVPPLDMLEKEKATLNGMDNMNVNVFNFSGDCVILTDTWKSYVVNCHNLETLRKNNPSIPGDHTSFPYYSVMSIAHPAPEYGTNNHLTILQSLSMIPILPDKFSLVRVKSADIRETVAIWDVKKMPYQHSISATKRYAIILACPFYMEFKKLLKTFVPRQSMTFNKDEPTTAYVVDLMTGKVQSFQTDSTVTLHHVNAFESDDNTIMLDVASYPDGAVLAFFDKSNLMNKTRRDNFPYKPSLKRFIIDLKKQKMTSMSFDVNPKVPHVNMLDMPTINELYRSRPYCYAYGVVFKSDLKSWGNFSIVKKDLCNSSGDLSWSVNNHYPMESWFVPNPDGTSEDDGVLLTPVLDGKLGKSYIVILDAKTMKPTTKAYLPILLPFHFHGRFMEDLY